MFYSRQRVSAGPPTIYAGEDCRAGGSNSSVGMSRAREGRNAATAAAAAACAASRGKAHLSLSLINETGTPPCTFVYIYLLYINTLKLDYCSFPGA